MNDKLQQAMMAMKLLEMLRGPQQQQQQVGMQEQELALKQQELEQRAMQQQQQLEYNQQRQQQLQQMGVLESLTGISRNMGTGEADPRMVLEYLRSIGVNVPQPPPQQQMQNPAGAYIQQNYQR